MQKKPYKIPEEKPAIAGEPVVAYGKNASCCHSAATEWNPNVPFHGTQEEWWEHFHDIEKGEFMTIEEADKEFETWKKKFLANRM